MTFAIGDEVTWSSQAQGYSKRERGIVVAYVPPGERPSKDDFPDLFKGAGAGWGRSTESWVVRVGRKHYWPVAKNLRRAGDNTCPACNGTGVRPHA
mgnify:CR=1 FL=1